MPQTTLSGSSQSARPARRTLKQPVTIKGRGLFTGVASSVTIRPAVVGEGGIEFRRVDLPGSGMIRARASRVAPEHRRTVLSAAPEDRNAASVQTVEHLLSALAGLGVTDALVEVDGPEVPMGDGSAQAFVEAMLSAGVADLEEGPDGMRDPVVVRESIVIEAGGGRIEAHPTEKAGVEFVYNLEYPHDPKTGGFLGIEPQQASIFLPWGAGVNEYVRQVAPARTFSLLAEAQAARQMGLFKHVEPKDMLVIGPDGPIDNAYRFANEPARHKLLDMIGDLALVARPIQARIVGTRTGHAANHELARRLAELR